MSTILPKIEQESSVHNSIYYCYKAIEALRHRLGTSIPPDELVIVSLWNLISAEANRGDVDAALTHLKGARAVFIHLQESGNPPGPPYVALIRACGSHVAAASLLGKHGSTSAGRFG
ncbi:uncharacterized protein PV07_02389 [Cladophialophora immunda]|uniref:Uncharacterized protein n=1 Tax=Cladophialophora immunda TaxID=569365 RepID=A0A0D2D0E7_9EURO|nr:uncharacterized protein PV07_02389 [Cladophialophora immunda]KIW35705.1 hypothetical protein PV07_02389 [Cladophialophora immunda]